MTLVEAVTGLIDRRAVLLAELAAIETDLAEARQLLGIETPSATAKPASLAAAVAEREPDAVASAMKEIPCADCGKPMQSLGWLKRCADCRLAAQRARQAKQLADSKRQAQADEETAARLARIEQAVPPAIAPDEPAILRAHDLPPELRPAVRPKPARSADDELETVWTPGRTAPSLSGDGLGSSLASETSMPSRRGGPR